MAIILIIFLIITIALIIFLIFEELGLYTRLDNSELFNDSKEVEIEGWSIPLKDLQSYDFDPLAAMKKAQRLDSSEFKTSNQVKAMCYTPMNEEKIYKIPQEND